MEDCQIQYLLAKQEAGDMIDPHVIIRENIDASVKDELFRVATLTRGVMEEIKAQYLEDPMPWVIGFSGGKDSTALLQLIFYAVSEIPVKQRTKELHVLSNDTLVENPQIVQFLDEQLKRIEAAGKSQLYAHNPDLFFVVKVVPKLEDTFWLNLIGKGYPSPNRWFRWCTERMKINPTNDYILKTVSKHGKVIIVLGTRKAESGNRAAAMQQYEIPGFRLRKHSLPNAYVFAPLANLSTPDVWAYLINSPNPWGSDNRELLNLYRSASDVMDCPLVIDDTTPSCGNSRFGCWTCTVVDQDKSMANMIQNGEEWMVPLIHFRNWLKKIRDDDSRREKRRRTGEPGLGPFNEDTRREILERLLEVECETGLTFISLQELTAIQYQWRYDGKFRYDVSEIYKKIKGKEIMLPAKSLIERREEEDKILHEICKKHGVNPDHVKELMELERVNLSFLRRPSIFEEMKRKIERFVNENGDIEVR